MVNFFRNFLLGNLYTTYLIRPYNVDEKFFGKLKDLNQFTIETTSLE